MPRIDTIKIRRDLASNWTSVNPVLAIGEMGYETDTLRHKFGNGTDAWNDLQYANPLEEAPDDGNQYARQDGAWAVIAPESNQTDDCGTVIPLTSIYGHFCNQQSANNSTSYTINDDDVVGSYTLVLINASTEPTITGATQQGGVDFIANTDLQLLVQNRGDAGIVYSFMSVAVGGGGSSSSNYLNIKDYNVNGDGSDETTDIAAAITAIPEGSTVYFPSGTYATDNPIIINKRLRVIGNGVDTVFKTFTAENEMGVDTGVIKVTSDNVTIQNIAIDGNYTISSGGGADRNAGLYVDAGVNYTIVKNLTAYNTPRQGLCVVGENGTYENITIYDTARHNISVGDGNNTINAAKNNYFKNITCLGGEDAAFEVNDGCEDIYVDGFNFSGTFSAAPLRVITHDRVGETNKNITFINGKINSNTNGAQIDSDSLTESNDNIKLINVDIVAGNHGIVIANYTNNFYCENVTIDATAIGVQVRGNANNIFFKDVNIKDYVSGSLLDIRGTVSNDLVNISIDNLTVVGEWDGGNAQNILQYIDGLTIKNTSLKPTTSTAGDCFQIQYCNNVLIQANQVRNYTSRIVFLGECNDVLIDGCFFEDNGSHSIASNLTTNLTVRKTKISGASSNGVNTTSCTNVTIDNCDLTDNDYGVFSSGDTTYKIVNGTTVYENNDISGIEFDGTNNITIANSTIRENYRHGMRILGGSFVNVNNNQIYNNNTSTIGGSGLQLRTDNVAIENIQITNNNIYDDQGTTTQDYAIDYRVDAGSLTNIIITGNMLKDAFNATFTPSATVIVDNNVEY